MTDDEAMTLFTKLAAVAAKPYLNREPGYEIAAGLDFDITPIMLHHGYRAAREDAVAAGITEAQADSIIRWLKTNDRIIEPGDYVPLPADLGEEIADAIKAEAALEVDADGADPQFLIERYMPFISEFRVEMYSDEGQHRGRPHVAVHLKDTKISISLDDPPEILTPKKARGEAAALKVIKFYRPRLLEEWYRTRPDTQRL